MSLWWVCPVWMTRKTMERCLVLAPRCPSLWSARPVRRSTYYQWRSWELRWKDRGRLTVAMYVGAPGWDAHVEAAADCLVALWDVFALDGKIGPVSTSRHRPKRCAGYPRGRMWCIMGERNWSCPVAVFCLPWTLLMNVFLTVFSGLSQILAWLYYIFSASIVVSVMAYVCM